MIQSCLFNIVLMGTQRQRFPMAMVSHDDAPNERLWPAKRNANALEPSSPRLAMLDDRMKMVGFKGQTRQLRRCRIHSSYLNVARAEAVRRDHHEEYPAVCQRNSLLVAGQLVRQTRPWAARSRGQHDSVT